MKLSYAVLAPMVSAIAHAIMLLLLARGADPAGVAQILALQVTIALAYTIIELGIGRELSVAAARGPLSEFRFLNRIHAYGLASTAIIVVLVLGALQVGPVPILIVVYCAAERRIAACLGASIASGRMLYSATALIVGRLTGLAALVAISLVTEWDMAVIYALVIAVSSVLLALVLSTIPRPHADPDERRRTLPKVLSVSMHYWATTLMGQARMLDVAIVSALLPLHIAGAYALPARALQPLRLVGTSIANVAFPLAARGENREVVKLLKIAWIASVAGTVLVVACLPFLSTLVTTILGEEYRASTTPLAIFAIGAAINMPGAVLSSVLQAIGKQRQITVLGVLLLVYQTIVLAIAAVIFGVVGAAVAVLSTYIIQLVVVSSLYRKRTNE